MRLVDLQKQIRDKEHPHYHVKGVAGSHANMTLIVGDKLVSGFRVLEQDGHKFIDLMVEGSIKKLPPPSPSKEPEEPIKGVNEPAGPLPPQAKSPFSN